jgi:hypothetical protein
MGKIPMTNYIYCYQYFSARLGLRLEKVYPEHVGKEMSFLFPPTLAQRPAALLALCNPELIWERTNHVYPGKGFCKKNLLLNGERCKSIKLKW